MKMTKVPMAGREAGSDSISPNPALNRGVFDSRAACEAIADAIEADDGPTGAPHSFIADMIESDDDFARADLTGAGGMVTLIGKREANDGPTGADTAAQDAPPATARSMGFDVAELNKSYALAIWGGKAVVVNEQPAGPIHDRIQVMSLDALQSWFSNRITQVMAVCPPTSAPGRPPRSRKNGDFCMSP
jgi:hypothetical protein